MSNFDVCAILGPVADMLGPSSPLIELSQNGQVLARLAPQAAIDLGLALLHSGEVAIADSYLLEVARGEMGLSEMEAHALLRRARARREAYYGQMGK
jgi:hypothetical protein